MSAKQTSLLRESRGVLGEWEQGASQPDIGVS